MNAKALTTILLFGILILIILLLSRCGLEDTAAGNTCWHENEKTCGVTKDGEQEVVLWCDDGVWKIWAYCGDGYCTTMNPYSGRSQTPMAHCVN